jgi:hypothetical protein
LNSIRAQRWVTAITVGEDPRTATIQKTPRGLYRDPATDRPW